MGLWSEGCGTVSEAIATAIEPIVDAAQAARDADKDGEVRWRVETDYATYVEIRFSPIK